MKLHLIGYHDKFEIKINELLQHDCFHDIILIEVPVTEFKEYFKYICKKIQESNDIELKLIKSDLEIKLRQNGISRIASANISNLVYLRPKKMIPCALKTKDEPEKYNSQRDQEILTLVRKAIKKFKEGDITFFGGNKHANYIANELTNIDMRLYDFRPEQIQYNLALNQILLNTLNH